jgi:hypothetical protein
MLLLWFLFFCPQQGERRVRVPSIHRLPIRSPRRPPPASMVRPYHFRAARHPEAENANLQTMCSLAYDGRSYGHRHCNNSPSLLLGFALQQKGLQRPLRADGPTIVTRKAYVSRPVPSGRVAHNDDLEQYGAMSHGSHGQSGNDGIVFFVNYRFYKGNKGSNPTVSAI